MTISGYVLFFVVFLSVAFLFSFFFSFFFFFFFTTKISRESAKRDVLQIGIPLASSTEFFVLGDERKARPSSCNHHFPISYFPSVDVLPEFDSCREKEVFLDKLAGRVDR